MHSSTVNQTLTTERSNLGVSLWLKYLGANLPKAMEDWSDDEGTLTSMATATFPSFAAALVHSLKVFLPSDFSQLPSQLSPSAVILPSLSGFCFQSPTAANSTQLSHRLFSLFLHRALGCQLSLFLSYFFLSHPKTPTSPAVIQYSPSLPQNPFAVAPQLSLYLPRLQPS